MVVKLLANTPDPEKLVAMAAKSSLLGVLN